MGHDRRRWARATAITALLLGLTAAVAGCGGGGGDDAGGAPTTTITDAASDGSVDPPDERSLLEAARRYNLALFEPRVDRGLATLAHRHLTAACQEELSVVDMESYLDEGVEQRRADMGAEAEVLTVGQVSIADVSAFEGQVLVTLVTPTDDDPMGWGVPLRQRWVVEDGEWRIDPCAESTTVDGASEQFRPVEVVASGSHQMNGEERWSTSWAAVVHNPNPDATAYDVEVTVDFIDADGNVVASHDELIIDIEPGRSGAAAGVVDAPGTDRLEVRARAASWTPGTEAFVMEGAVTGTTFTEAAAPGMTPTTDVTGTTTNLSDVDLGGLPVVVFVDPTGAIQGGIDVQFMIDGYVAPGRTVEWSGTTSAPIPSDWTFLVYVTPTAPDYTDYRAEYDGLLDEG